jgi:hypothetical protein
MKINSDDFATHLLAQVLRLQAEVYVLNATIVSISEQVTPGVSEILREKMQEQTESVYQQLLIDHPFLKNDFDDLLSSVFPKV